MASASFSSIVLCVGPVAASLGKAMTEMQRDYCPESPLFIWELSNQNQTYYCRNIEANIPSIAGQSDSGYPTPADAIAAIVTSVLSIGNTAVTQSMDETARPRLMLLAASWEIEAALAADVADIFSRLGWRHVGIRHLTEACFLLPDLIANIPPEASAACKELVQLLQPSNIQDSSAAARSRFHYCWWLSRINSSGLTLPYLPDAEKDLATAICSLLSVQPVLLPQGSDHPTDGPLQASTGYSELYVNNSQVFEWLNAHHAEKLICEDVLNKRGSVDMQNVRATASAFVSTKCEDTIRDTVLTGGGQRIWREFNPSIPNLSAGQDREFRDSLHIAYREFRGKELAVVRATTELHGLKRRDDLLKEIEDQVRHVAEMSEGGLYAGLALTEEITALLMKEANSFEAEKRANLQQVRKRFERAFYSRVHPDKKLEADHSSVLGELRQKRRQLKRLQNIAAPPALDADIFYQLTCDLDGSSRTRIPDAIRSLEAEIESYSAALAQDALDEDAELHKARYTTADAEKSRDSRISNADWSLAESCRECRKILNDLAESMDWPLQAIISRFWKTRRIKRYNARLREVQDRINREAHELISAYADRMQFSVDLIVYDVRDLIIQAAFTKLRSLFSTLSTTIQSLTSIAEELGTKNSPVASNLLSRSVLSEDDLVSLHTRLAEREGQREFRPYFSAWEICFQSRSEIEDLFIRAASPTFEVVLHWGIDDFLKFLRVPSAHIEKLAHWVKNSGTPLFPPLGRHAAGISILRAPEEGELAGALHRLLPTALVEKDSIRIKVSALQIQRVWDVQAALTAMFWDDSPANGIRDPKQVQKASA